MNATNKIANGGFEEGAYVPWNMNLASLDASHSHSGRYCARLMGGEVDAAVTQSFAVIPGQHFEVAVSLAKLGSEPSPPIAVALLYLDEASALIGYGLHETVAAGSLSDVTSNNWAELTCRTSPAPANTVSGTIVVLKTSCAGSPDVLVDDVAVLEL